MHCCKQSSYDLRAFKWRVICEKWTRFDVELLWSRFWVAENAKFYERNILLHLSLTTTLTLSTTLHLHHYYYHGTSLFSTNRIEQELEYLGYNEPAVVKPKGRPSGASNKKPSDSLNRRRQRDFERLTRRELSGFERVESLPLEAEVIHAVLDSQQVMNSQSQIASTSSSVASEWQEER